MFLSCRRNFNAHKTCLKCCINDERTTGKKHTTLVWDNLFNCVYCLPQDVQKVLRQPHCILQLSTRAAKYIEVDGGLFKYLLVGNVHKLTKYNSPIFNSISPAIYLFPLFSLASSESVMNGTRIHMKYFCSESPILAFL